MPHQTRLIYAVSGLGKSTLCRQYPDLTYDTDTALDVALAVSFPDVPPELRRATWRRFARSRPWQDHSSKDYFKWATTRRRLITQIMAQLNDLKIKIVSTNTTIIPARYHHYYGVELGQYEYHWSLLNRTPQTGQDESTNNRLEGYNPLTRISPGQFLGERAEIIDWLER